MFLHDLKDTIREGSVISNIAHLYWLLSDYRKAEKMSIQSIKLLQTGSASISLSSAHNKLGVITPTKVIEQAIDHYQQALLVAKKLKAGHLLSETYNNLGGLHNTYHQTGKALHYFHQATEGLQLNPATYLHWGRYCTTWANNTTN